MAGEWQGTLTLYPAKEGTAPEFLQLSLDTRGELPAGRVRILFHKGEPLEADVTPRIEGEVLSFSFPDPHLFEGTLNLRAVLVEGELRGVASVVDSQGGRWFGSWSARSVQGPPSTELQR